MVKHVFKSGETSTDITGHKVTRADCPRVYEILERMEGSYEQNRTGQDIQKKRTHPAEDIRDFV